MTRLTNANRLPEARELLLECLRHLERNGSGCTCDDEERCLERRIQAYLGGTVGRTR